MCQDGKVILVRYGFHVADLFSASDDYNRYDVEECARKFADLCQAALEQEYPDAEVEVVFDTGVSGASPSLMTTEVLRREYRDGELCEFSDPYDIERVEKLCDEIHHQYKWVVPRPWLTISKAHKLFGVPVPTIRWACKEGLVAEAEKKAGRWEFPLEAFTEIVDSIVSIDFRETYDIGIEDNEACMFQCDLDDTQHVRAADFPEIQVLVVAPNGFGMPLLSSDNSTVLVSKCSDTIDLVFEHFIDETPWTGVQWSYDIYGKTLVSQASQHESVDCEWQESQYDEKTFVDGVQFKFTYESSQPNTLRELIDQSVGILESIVQETEIRLSGGPIWKQEYEKDEILFCTEILDPLLRKMGFESVRYTHGRKEYGKDFTFSEPTKFGDWRHYGLQAKAGSVSGEVNSEIDDILGQIEDAFKVPYRELGSKEERFISTFIVAISGHFTENAEEKIRYKTPEAFARHVYFWDKQGILGLIAKYWIND